VNNKPHKVEILERNDKAFLVKVNDKTFTVKTKSLTQGIKTKTEINSKQFHVKIDRTQKGTIKVEISGKIFEVQPQPSAPSISNVKLEPTSITRGPTVRIPVNKDAVMAPIAGRIVLLKANVGQRVEKGECICVLEAMKMENEIMAPKAGVVQEIKVSEGAAVHKREVLAIIK
jgi:biotin carboxyl carrier protein